MSQSVVARDTVRHMRPQCWRRLKRSISRSRDGAVVAAGAKHCTVTACSSPITHATNPAGSQQCCTVVGSSELSWMATCGPAKRGLGSP